MPANVHKDMVYSFQKPMWHNITAPSLVPMSAKKILEERFHGGFPIDLRPVTVELNGVQTETGDFAIVRGTSVVDPDEVVFGYCSDRYHPLQPIEVAESFDANVQEPAETMAFLGEGQEMFISWNMPPFEVVLGDVLELYGIVRCGFDTLKSARLFTSIYRPVCANTINLAEGWAKANTDKNKKGVIWKGKGVNKNLLRDLGYWMEHVQSKALSESALLKDFLSNLAATPIDTDTKAYEILYDAYPNSDDVSSYYPKQLREKKQEIIAEYNVGQGQLRDSIYKLFNGGGIQVTPTFWGLLCATSQYFCHVQPSKKPIAESVMFGSPPKEYFCDGASTNEAFQVKHASFYNYLERGSFAIT